MRTHKRVPTSISIDIVVGILLLPSRSYSIESTRQPTYASHSGGSRILDQRGQV